MTTIATDLPRPLEIVSGWLTMLLAVSCGLIVANLYYAQPLVGPISADQRVSRLVFIASDLTAEAVQRSYYRFQRHLVKARH